MPIQNCSANGRPGYRWGRNGTCYTYAAGNDAARRQAKQKAIKQGIAAGEIPAAIDGVALSKDFRAGFDRVERLYLGALVERYALAIREAASIAASKFAITASASEWHMPVEGTIFTAAELKRLSATLRQRLEPVWERVVIDAAGAPLARVRIAWDVKEPLTHRLVVNAGRRVESQLGDAVRLILRDAMKEAYDQGMSVREAATVIKQRITDAAPWQADMLARTDLNSLANGASHAGAQKAGMGFKTWLATLDGRTRPEHADANGQTVPINDTFTVGGEDAQYPGDPNLSDAMACNCRCTLTYGETIDESEALVSSARALASR